MAYTFTDGTNTFTGQAIDVQSSPIWNASVDITIGGRPVSTADTQRLEIIAVVTVTEDELLELNEVIENFGEELTFTPPYALYGKSTVEDITVVFKKEPELVDQGLNEDGETVYYLKLEMEEVKIT
jgi:hypothetical protein